MMMPRSLSGMDQDEIAESSFDETPPAKLPRSMLWVALMGVMLITAGCVGALAYALAINSSATAEQALQTIGLIGIGSLSTMLGVKAASSGEDD